MRLTKKLFSTHKIILTLLIIYFFIHLINLTGVPIFNDESIYLDWGWADTHIPGHIYDSLYDAKQPLMIWLFGMFENFSSNPLIAGRFLAVLFGASTLWGIFKLASKLFTEQIAFFATLSYIIIPIFVFYNRQALFEPAVASLGIWSSIALLNIINKPDYKNGIYLGILLGFGFFIKSSFLIFIFSASLLLIYFIFRKKSIAMAKAIGIATISFFCVSFLVLINPLFWQTLSSNDRYAFGIGDLLHFPITTWLASLTGFAEIGFFSISPLVFLLSLVGIVILFKKRKTNIIILIGFYLFSLFLEIFSVKSQNQRYLVPFLTFLVIPLGYMLDLLWNSTMVKKVIVIVSLILPLAMTTILIFNPYYYFTQLNKYSSYSDIGYVSGQTSGYGIDEVMQYIQEHSIPNKPTLVLFGLNAGNPENAVDVYSEKSTNLFGFHIDSRFFGNLNQIDCMTSSYPLYLVTREDQTLGLQKYFILTKKFDNPDSNYFVGLYTLKNNCNGKSVSLSNFYQSSLLLLSQIRNGY